MLKQAKKKVKKEAREQGLSWEGLVGFHEDFEKLSELLKTGKMPSVLLFDGNEGIGKRLFLFKIAALHLCEHGSACGMCSSCQWLQHNKHPDVLFIEAESKQTIKSSSILEITEFLDYSPKSSSPFAKRIVIIVDVENMTTAAVNKLLKTFEEPSASARILLSTGHRKRMLPTLLSRCVRWHLHAPKEELVEELLRKQFPELCAKHKDLRKLIEQYSCSFSQILEHLREDEDQRALTFIKMKSTKDILTFAEQFRQSSDANLSDFLKDYEHALNTVYREALANKSHSMLGALRERREYLSEVKKLADKERIALNSQMVIENLALYNLNSRGLDGRM